MNLKVKQTKGFGKIKGLIGSQKPEAIFFHTRWGIHTFGVKFSIDVVILDDSYTVVALRENLKPNRIFLWNPRYKNVLELPQGSIKKEKIKMGMKIEISSVIPAKARIQSKDSPK